MNVSAGRHFYMVIIDEINITQIAYRSILCIFINEKKKVLRFKCIEYSSIAEEASWESLFTIFQLCTLDFLEGKNICLADVQN